MPWNPCSAGKKPVWKKFFTPTGKFWILYCVDSASVGAAYSALANCDNPADCIELLHHQNLVNPDEIPGNSIERLGIEHIQELYAGIESVIQQDAELGLKLIKTFREEMSLEQGVTLPAVAEFHRLNARTLTALGMADEAAQATQVVTYVESLIPKPNAELNDLVQKALDGGSAIPAPLLVEGLRLQARQFSALGDEVEAQRLSDLSVRLTQRGIGNQ
jgi:hypothetical protein